MSKSYVSTNKAPSAIGPYSQGIVSNNVIFTSGQLPINPENEKLIEGNIKEATKQCIENIKAILVEAGFTLKDIVKITIFITDMNNFGFVNEIYGEYFNKHKPARTCVEVSKLPKNAEIEIEAIAFR